MEVQDSSWDVALFQRTVATSSSRSSSPRLIGLFAIDDEGDLILKSGGNYSSIIAVSHLRICESSATILCETQVSRHGGSPLSTKVINFVSF